jgi:hypothetical protein
MKMFERDRSRIGQRAAGEKLGMEELIIGRGDVQGDP